jgi:hypothetical protein
MTGEVSNVNMTVSDAASVAQALAIDAASSGTLAFTTGISDNAAAFAGADGVIVSPAVTTLLGQNPKVTITDTATLAQLITVNAGTSGLVTATATTSISGSAANVKLVTDAIGSSGDKIALSAMTGEVSNVNVTVSDAASVVQALAIDAASSGTLAFTTGISDNAAAFAGADGTIVSTAITTLLGQNPKVAITDSATLAQLLTVNGATTGLVTAIATTSISGSLSNVKLVTDAIIDSGNGIKLGTIAGSGPGTTSSNASITITPAVNISSGTDVTNLNAIEAKTIGVITATLTGTVANLKNLTNLSSNNAYTIMVTDTGTTSVLGDTPVSAADLKAIDSLTTEMVDAPNLNYISGTDSDLKAIFTSEGFTYNRNANVTITGTLNASEVTIVDGLVDGVITASVSGSAVSLNNLVSGNNYTITVLAAPLLAPTDAADLIKVDAATTNLVNATTITSISGTVANVKTVTDAIKDVNDGIQLGTVTSGATTSNIDITISDALSTPVSASNLKSIVNKTSGSVTIANAVAISGSLSDVTAALVTDASLVAGSFSVGVSDVSGGTASQLNAIAAKTTGVVTATISDHDVTRLSTLITDSAANAYTISVADTSVNAADLNTLDGKTTVAVNALSVGRLTGSAANIATVISAETIDTSSSVLVTVDAITGLTSTDVTNLNLIDTNTTGVMTATISGAIAVLNTLSNNTANNAYTVTVSDSSVSGANLIALDGKTTVAVNALSVGTLTGSAANIATAISAATIDTSK